MSTTLAKQMTVEKEADLLSQDLVELVSSAAKVISPYGPIDKFAARNPWDGMESLPFEQVARKLKGIIDVDILPDKQMIKSAWESGKINEDYLIAKLDQWLEKNDTELPDNLAKKYCLAALMDFSDGKKNNMSPEIKSVAKKLVRLGHDTEEKQFIKTLSQQLEQIGTLKAANILNQYMIKWCKLYLDRSQAVLSMPYRENGFYFAWRSSAQLDPNFKQYRDELLQTPEDATIALEETLLKLGIPYSEIQAYLEAHLLCLPGWAGMMLWRAENVQGEENLLIDYLAARLTTEWLIIKKHLPLPEQKQNQTGMMEELLQSWAKWGELPADSWYHLSFSEIKSRLSLAFHFDEIIRNQLWLQAWEETYEDELREIITEKNPSYNHVTKPNAQFVFCIDVRSEPFRRKLEKVGPFETIGTAGFFGLPIETCELGSDHVHPSLPVLFKPQYKIRETSAVPELKNYLERQQVAGSFSHTFKNLKQQLMSSMLLPEISGPWLSLQTLARSFMPRRVGSSLRKMRKSWAKKPATQLTLDRKERATQSIPTGFSKEEKIHFARQALVTMGLTDYFAPLIVICGHGSISTNNPYAASLDCGACGGASSGFNARVLTSLCNDQEVRKALAEEGIVIPHDTVFVAAEHITSLDELRWLDVPNLSERAQEAFEQVQAALSQVHGEANAERIVQIPSYKRHDRDPSKEARRLAEDWSEVRPEWGLAKNASFIIGERKLTESCNLEGRSFLHNYDWRKDPDGTILNNIISGPATVAQWINLQYYASTVAPHYYGSGNKTTQTVTAGIGVMQGNASDLLTGLPWQSVMQSDREYFHEPLRLLVVIQAPRKYIERLLEGNSLFKQKLANGWIRLASIDSDGQWISWT